jgi:hypothetical protein
MAQGERISDIGRKEEQQEGCKCGLNVTDSLVNVLSSPEECHTIVKATVWEALMAREPT